MKRVICSVVLATVVAQSAGAAGGSRRTLDLPIAGAGDIFLLKADGTPFKDDRGKYRGEITVGSYTSRLTLGATASGSGDSRFLAIVAELPTTDGLTHGLSDDRPVLSLEVDGKPLRDGVDFDSVISTLRRGQERATRLTLNLMAPGLEKIQQAVSRVALKVRLRSDAFAAGGECTTASPGSAVAEACRKPYTGRTVEGKALARLKVFLAQSRSAGGG